MATLHREFIVDLWECALGFMDSQVLLTAEGLGIFDHLDTSPRTAGGIAAETGLMEDSAERLLTALCALQIVQRRPGGRYINGPDAAERLVRGKPGYIGAMFQHVRDDLYPVWDHLGEALLEGTAQWKRISNGRPAPTEGMYSDPGALRAFMEGMHAITHQAAAEFARNAAPELNGIESITDVGGASGAFVIALAETRPQLRGTVLDLPALQPIAEDFFRKSALEDRLDFHAADFWEDPIPPGADAYSLGFILHDWDETGGSILLQKIAEAARPGALLIIGEYLLDDEKAGPLHVARQDLNMLVAARGRERSAAEYRDWIREFGFELEQIYPTFGGKNFLIARR